MATAVNKLFPWSVSYPCNNKCKEFEVTSYTLKEFVSFKICLTYTRGTIYNVREAVSMIKQNCQCVKYFPRNLSHWWYSLYALSWEKGQCCFPWINALKVISYIESNTVTSYQWFFFLSIYVLIKPFCM